jgi:hypothetical protein
MLTSLSPTRRRLMGFWFAVSALCALNLLSLQHYQRMLVADAVCSVGAAGTESAGPKGQANHHDAACALSCAQGQAAGPLDRLSLVAATAFRVEFVAPGALGKPVTRAWSIGQPRGPPRLT